MFLKLHQPNTKTLVWLPSHQCSISSSTPASRLADCSGAVFHARPAGAARNRAAQPARAKRGGVAVQLAGRAANVALFTASSPAANRCRSSAHRRPGRERRQWGDAPAAGRRARPGQHRNRPPASHAGAGSYPALRRCTAGRESARWSAGLDCCRSNRTGCSCRWIVDVSFLTRLAPPQWVTMLLVKVADEL